MAARCYSLITVWLPSRYRLVTVSSPVSLPSCYRLVTVSVRSRCRLVPRLVPSRFVSCFYLLSRLAVWLLEPLLKSRTARMMQQTILETDESLYISRHSDRYFPKVCTDFLGNLIHKTVTFHEICRILLVTQKDSWIFIEFPYNIWNKVSTIPTVE